MKKSESNLPEISSKVTESVLRDYDLRIFQPQNGYRFSVDSLLLADFVRLRKRDHVLDIGTGCGVIALILAKKYGNVNIVALEIQNALVRIAEKNIRLNDLKGQISILEENLCEIPRVFRAGSFDHVVTNPPYRSPASGRLCKNSQETISRHEILTNLDKILSAARHALHPGGRVSLIYPAERAAELLAGMHKLKLEPKRLRMIHPDRNSSARMVLVEGCRDAGEELRVLPPVFINVRA